MIRKLTIVLLSGLICALGVTSALAQDSWGISEYEKATGKTIDKIVLNIDIPATILDLAGISQPQFYQGKSLLPILNNENIETWRESFLCEHRMEHNKLPKYVAVVIATII